MKRMKKIVGLLMAMVMILGMSMTVLANETQGQATTGSISISNPISGQVYNIYKMFDLEAYDTVSGAYLYSVTPEWEEFVETGDGSQYFEIYDEIYVKLKGTESLADEQKVALAKAAIAYAEGKGLTVAATLPIVENGATRYTASGLDLGYYTVSSTMGALCGLTTVAPNSSVKEKNTIPTVNKEVMEDVNKNGVEDDNLDTWGESNDATIGDTVYFRTTISAKSGAHKYILHDRMGDGLTLNKDSIVVTDVTGTLNVKIDDETPWDYELKFDHESESNVTEVCDFEIHFSEEYLATITTDMDIVVTYSAVLNQNAKIYEEANRNATKLEYGDHSETEVDYTYTYTYMFDVIKTDADNKVLNGAQFELYYEGTGNTLKDENNADIEVGDKVSFISLGNGSYDVVKTGTTNAIDTITAGSVRIKGLDSGTYYLVEKAAPVGYNKVNYAIKIEINDANKLGKVTNGYYVENSGGYQVINQTGTLLPETGGVGKPIFFIGGACLAIGASVIIVTKKRMKCEA